MSNAKKAIAITLALVLIIVTAGVYGNMKQQQQLLDNVNYIDNNIADIVLEIENDLNDMNAVGLNAKNEELEVLQQEIIVMRDEYDKDETEYQMYEEINITIDYLQEMIVIMIGLINNPYSAFLDTSLAQLETYAEKVEEHKDNYEKLKDALGVEQVEEVEIEVNEL